LIFGFLAPFDTYNDQLIKKGFMKNFTESVSLSLWKTGE